MHPDSASPEILEVCDFLREIQPFGALPAEDIEFAARNIKISYHKKGSLDQILDYENPSLFIVRAGVFDIFADDQLIDRIGRNGFFGFISLLTGDSLGHHIGVHEDGLLYCLNNASFQQLRKRNDEFDRYFNKAFAQRLQVGLSKRQENSGLATRISAVMANNFVSVPENYSIQQTAQTMSEQNISAVGICDDDNRLIGIFTDRDCRKRVVANNIDGKLPIAEVMSAKPVTVKPSTLVHETQILMMRHGFKHLPVIKKGRPVGMVTLSDLLRLQRSDPVVIMKNIHRAADQDELVSVCEHIPDLLLHLIRVDARADDLGRILTSVTGALTRRLIQLAQQQLGPEPVPFTWIAFGSQGRQDQSAKSDQDNGLLLSNDFTDEHDDYFHQLAQFVNKGLDACGYVYCPGDIMAQNQRWRQPLREWKSIFKNWTSQPSPKALMHCSIFFDMRAIYSSDGGEDLLPKLQKSVLKMAQKNSIFLNQLTRNALELTPPIGVMRRLIVESDGKHKDTLDIKLRGMMPITDIARIHALANGITAVNTRDRLEELIDLKALNKKDGRNLLDAHEYIAHQRLTHQGKQLANGEPPDNHLNPNIFSSLTIRQLKDAFKVVRDAQNGLKLKYSHGVS